MSLIISDNCGRLFGLFVVFISMRENSVLALLDQGVDEPESRREVEEVRGPLDQQQIADRRKGHGGERTGVSVPQDRA